MKRVQVTLSLEFEAYDKIKELADNNFRTVNSQARAMVLDKLQELNTPDF